LGIEDDRVDRLLAVKCFYAVAERGTSRVL
jgi:hypothetical protein